MRARKVHYREPGGGPRSEGERLPKIWSLLPLHRRRHSPRERLDVEDPSTAVEAGDRRLQLSVPSAWLALRWMGRSQASAMPRSRVEE